jgi:hypothetical protein
MLECLARDHYHQAYSLCSLLFINRDYRSSWSGWLMCGLVKAPHSHILKVGCRGTPAAYHRAALSHNLHQRIWRKSTWDLNSEEATRQRQTTTTAKMRTYDDSFSGQRIYPGKVRTNPSLRSSPTANVPPRVPQRAESCSRSRMTPDGGRGGRFVDGIWGDITMVEKTAILTMLCSTG